MKRSSKTTYGNGLSTLISSAIFGATVFAASLWITGQGPAPWRTRLFTSAAIGSILPALTALTILSRIEIEKPWFRLVVFGRWVVSEKLLADLVSMGDWAGPMGLEFRFRDGSRVYLFPGASLFEIFRLRSDLARSAPNFERRSS